MTKTEYRDHLIGLIDRAVQSPKYDVAKHGKNDARLREALVEMFNWPEDKLETYTHAFQLFSSCSDDLIKLTQVLSLGALANGDVRDFTPAWMSLTKASKSSEPVIMVPGNSTVN